MAFSIPTDLTAPSLIIETDEEEIFTNPPFPERVTRIASLESLTKSVHSAAPLLESGAFAPIHDKSSPELKTLVAQISIATKKIEQFQKICEEVRLNLFFRTDEMKFDAWLATMRETEPKIERWYEFVRRLLLNGAQIKEIASIPETLNLEIWLITLFLLKKECREMQILLQDPSFRKMQTWYKSVVEEFLRDIQLTRTPQAQLVDITLFCLKIFKNKFNKKTPHHPVVQRGINQLKAQGRLLAVQILETQYQNGKIPIPLALLPDHGNQGLQLSQSDSPEQPYPFAECKKVDALYLSLGAPSYLTQKALEAPCYGLLYENRETISTEEFTKAGTLPDVYTQIKGGRDYYIGKKSATWDVYKSGKLVTKGLSSLNLEIMQLLKSLAFGLEKHVRQNIPRDFEEENKHYRRVFYSLYREVEQNLSHLTADSFNLRSPEMMDRISGMEGLCEVAQDRLLLLHGLTQIHGDLFEMTRRLRIDLAKTEKNLKGSIHFYFTAKAVLEAHRKKRSAWEIFPMDSLIQTMLDVRWEIVAATGPKFVELDPKESLVFTAIMNKTVIFSDTVKSYLVKRITNVLDFPLNPLQQAELALVFDAFEKDPVLRKALDAAKIEKDFAKILEDFLASPLAHPISAEECSLARKMLFMLHKAKASQNMFAFAEGWQALCDLKTAENRTQSEALTQLLEVGFSLLSETREAHKYPWPLFDASEECSLLPRHLVDVHRKELRFRILSCLCFGTHKRELEKATFLLQNFTPEDYQEYPSLYTRILLRKVCQKVVLDKMENSWLLKEHFTPYFEDAEYDSSDMLTLRALFHLIKREEGMPMTPFTDFAKEKMKERFSSFIAAT